MPPRQKSTHESSPKTTMGGTKPEILPDTAVVREWDYKELQEYLKPLLSKFSDTTRKKFEDAEIDGELFLELGSGKLPPGEGYEEFISAWYPRQVLKERAMEILGDATGSEKRNIDQAEGARPDPKKLRTEADEPSRYDGNLVKAQILHAILWGKEDEVREKIFLKRTVTVPAFNESQTTELIECKRLDLGPLLVTYFENTPSAPVHFINWEVLPCASNCMLVRGAYEEAYGYISTRDANRRKQKGHSRLNTDRAVIMTGHPGIGKKWFLSYVLVERLLKSMPTIVQYSWDEIDATHILFDENGARLVTSFTRELANNSEIWVLCSQKPLGLAPLTDQHAWYLVIATAPNPSNTKAVKKHYPPFINMAQWTWAELVCTERYTKKKQLRNMHQLVTMFGAVPRLVLDRLMSRPSFKEDGEKQTDEGGHEWPSVDLGDQDDQDDDLDENPNVIAFDTLEDRVALELYTIEGLTTRPALPLNDSPPNH